MRGLGGESSSGAHWSGLDAETAESLRCVLHSRVPLTFEPMHFRDHDNQPTKDLPGVGPGVAFPGAPRTPGNALHGYGARSEI
ncbi:hypothetical protein CF328_g8258 [Tilletia controversa]|nr:hypothetical protein CF328_g8258 [Tilletia controversa]